MPQGQEVPWWQQPLVQIGKAFALTPEQGAQVGVAVACLVKADSAEMTEQGAPVGLLMRMCSVAYAVLAAVHTLACWPQLTGFGCLQGSICLACNLA